MMVRLIGSHPAIQPFTTAGCYGSVDYMHT